MRPRRAALLRQRRSRDDLRQKTEADLVALGTEAGDGGTRLAAEIAELDAVLARADPEAARLLRPVSPETDEVQDLLEPRARQAELSGRQDTSFAAVQARRAARREVETFLRAAHGAAGGLDPARGTFCPERPGLSWSGAAATERRAACGRGWRRVSRGRRGEGADTAEWGI